MPRIKKFLDKKNQRMEKSDKENINSQSYGINDQINEINKTLSDYDKKMFQSLDSSSVSTSISKALDYLEELEKETKTTKKIKTTEEEMLELYEAFATQYPKGSIEFETYVTNNSVGTTYDINSQQNYDAWKFISSFYTFNQRKNPHATNNFLPQTTLQERIIKDLQQYNKIISKSTNFNLDITQYINLPQRTKNMLILSTEEIEQSPYGLNDCTLILASEPIPQIDKFLSTEFKKNLPQEWIEKNIIQIEEVKSKLSK